MKIRLAFWGGLGGQSATLGHVRGFQHFGDVEFIPCIRVKAHHINQGADLFYTPDIRLMQDNDPGLFSILQMGGRGSGDMWTKGAFDTLHKVAEHAEVVTMLDTNLLHFLQTKKQPWNWKKFFLVPNGMHYNMFKPKTKNSDGKFTVFTGKIGGVGKAGVDMAKVSAKIKQLGYLDRIQLMAPVQRPGIYMASPFWTAIEPQPFYKMPQLYQNADVYLNVPEVEVLPNTIFEAFLTGLPVVVSGGSSIARLQSVPLKHVEAMRRDFGTSVDYFDETWKPHYDAGAGEHYLQGKTIQDIADLLVRLYENPDLRKKLGDKARQWALKLNWSFRDKCQCLMKLAENAGLKVD